MIAPGERRLDHSPATETTSPASQRILRFGLFELNKQAGELRKSGLKIKLQGQPVQVLTFLLEHSGNVVTRHQLRAELWPNDTFVDFDHNLNSAVKRLRDALSDSAENPRFIETLPRHGYRFIAPVSESPLTAQLTGKKRNWIALAAVIVAAVLIGFGSLSFWQRLGSRAQAPSIHSLALLPLENLSDDPADQRFADGLTEELTTELGQLRSLRVISRRSVLQYKGTAKSLSKIADELHVDVLLQASVLRAGNRVRVTTQLIRAFPEEHLWAQSYERDIGDLITLQREIAGDIAAQVKLALTPQTTVK